MRIKLKDINERRAMRWVQQAASTDYTRERLTGMYVDNGRTIAVDGFCMFIAPTPLEYLDHQGKIIRPEKRIPVSPKELEYDEVDATYPDYEYVVPKGEPTFQIAISRKFLGKLADMPADDDKLILSFTSDTAPMLVKSIKDGQEYTAVVMPMHIGR